MLLSTRTTRLAWFRCVTIGTLRDTATVTPVAFRVGMEYVTIWSTFALANMFGTAVKVRLGVLAFQPTVKNVVDAVNCTRICLQIVNQVNVSLVKLFYLLITIKVS